MVDCASSGRIPGAARQLYPRAFKMDDVTLSQEEIQRYSRHLVLPEVGLDGQRRLKRARVLLIGTGGLGSPVGLYLAAAGVGRLGLVDFDLVDPTNLQRQIVFGTSDVGRSKLAAAGERLRDVNPAVDVARHEVRLTGDNAIDIVEGYDVVIDGTDNFPTRYLINDACVLTRKPDVFGSVFRFEGQATVFALPDGPCYRCLYPQPPPPGLVPSCAAGGVMGVLPGIVGAIQANEAIKLILGAGDGLAGRLLLFDALAMRFREIKVRRDPACPVCGDRPTIRELVDYDAFCSAPSATAAPTAAEVPEIDPLGLKARIDSGEDIALLDVRELGERALCNIGGSLIPLAQIPTRVGELDRARPLVVYCRLGERSAHVVAWLLRQGFEHVWNLRGGLHAWADDIDPSLPKY